MSNPERWEARYETGNLPWDAGFPDKNLVRLIESQTVVPCHALEIGCGTGTNSIWLARQGFRVLGVDISAKAVAQARAKAREAGANVRFETLDFLSAVVPGAPFLFLFDRGCFHSMRQPASRMEFALRASRLLEPGGMWFSLIGNADTAPREAGPPTLSAVEIALAIEPWFEIQSLAATHFDSNQSNPALAWACLALRREPKRED
ncbi:MAG: Mg-protoporphyrin IX methyl transferase [candidate division BRC1 bacterium ADurb.BinA364]|nr:MAG: Mg-protoporphyrin IX methyl transferase [candidate division BRC1 bacterium ADurb.BinA364]